MIVDFRCQACEKDFDWERLPGNHLQRRRICQPCREWHAWCNKCKRAKLHSEFDRCAASPIGIQSMCRSCRIDRHGLIKVRACGRCQGEHIVSEHRSYNGRSEWTCDPCRAAVKHCTQCNSYRPIGEFAKRGDTSVGRTAHCRTCMAAKWTAADHSQRTRAKRSRFGLSYDEYLAMCIEQGNRCRVCGNPETDVHQSGRTRELAIDHDHSTGEVRGLLCGKCNKAIGLMLDDPERLRSAAEYLESSRLTTAKGGELNGGLLRGGS